MSKTIHFFVTFADGFFGSAGTPVLSSHLSLHAARKAAGTSGRFAVRVGYLTKGDIFMGGR